MAYANELPIDSIEVGDRLRSVNRTVVEQLKESIAKIGLKTPISVRYKGDDAGGDYKLVTGLHRHVACTELQWKYIPVREETGTELDAQLWEIDENLCRAELTELERGEHLVARKRIYEQDNPTARHGGDRRSDDFKWQNLQLENFASDTATSRTNWPRRCRTSVAKIGHSVPDT